MIHHCLHPWSAPQMPQSLRELPCWQKCASLIASLALGALICYFGALYALYLGVAVGAGGALISFYSLTLCMKKWRGTPPSLPQPLPNPPQPSNPFQRPANFPQPSDSLPNPPRPSNPLPNPSQSPNSFQRPANFPQPSNPLPNPSQPLINNTPQHPPLEIEDSLQTFVRDDDEYAPRTVGRPCSVEKVLNFQGNEAVRKQGYELGQNFYYQHARGNGNCFYLSYLSGFLHSLIASNNFNEMINKIRTNPFHCKEKKAFIDEVEELGRSPSYKTLYELLENEDRVEPLISYLRQFAIHYVFNLKEKLVGANYQACPIDYIPKSDKECRFVWDVPDLFGPGGIIENGGDLRVGIEKKGGLSRANYCAYQGGDMIDAQRPEIAMLHDYFCPLRMYQRKDVQPIPESENGLVAHFSPNSPLVVLWSGNHFDCLIPKERS
jgi:hypothetical protein